LKSVTTLTENEKAKQQISSRKKEFTIPRLLLFSQAVDMTIALTDKLPKPETAYLSSPQDDRKIGCRSRGWTPLKYPKSAIDSEESFVYFPLHKDVLLATARELLVLDGTLNGTTLQLSKQKAKYMVNGGESSAVRFYQRHLKPDSWPLSAELEEEYLHENGCRKRKKHQMGRNKRIKLEYPNVTETTKSQGELLEPEVDETTPSLVDSLEVESHRVPSPEEIATVIVNRARMVVVSLEEAGSQHDPIQQSAEKLLRRPRKVSDSDQTPSYGQLSPHREMDQQQFSYSKLSSSRGPLGPIEEEDKDLYAGESQEISQILDLHKRNPEGTFPMRSSIHCIPQMVHASIFNEALLRDAAMSMTQQLLVSVPDRALRLFFGYKSPSITRGRLARLLAGFLFDTSHAMFAWEQTEQEVLASGIMTTSLDSRIQKSLFDDRALKKIGGFEPSSLLPQAISIARLRRRQTSWKFFATTAQGKRMLDHHSREKSTIAVGKQRRGQRLRQRHFLTSSLLWQETTDCDVSLSTTGPRSRSCSIVSSTDEGGEEDVILNHQGGRATVDLTRHARILADMPGSKAISLVKQPPKTSWGVCLAKEGDACVVGRARERPSVDDDRYYLRCGDLILLAQNERGQEASSPLCAWSNVKHGQEDWFRALVDLFKTSEELHLVVQRV
jgi:hypothetical protein